jgi:diguanylate cyclase (GGDEF)-like protein
MDIDHFKTYNDRYGHLQGDECLRMVAQALLSGARRPSELVARYGGEEFACILPDTPLEGAVQVARQQCAAVAALQRPHAGSSVASYVTVSLGVATLTPSVGQAQADLITRADERLSRALAMLGGPLAGSLVRQHSSRRPRGSAGFSLLDLIFVMLIVLIVLVPMSGLFPMGHAAVQKGQYITVATALAEQQISQLRQQFPTLTAGGTPPVTNTVVTVDNVNYTVVTQLWPAGYRPGLTATGQPYQDCFLVDVQVVVTYPDGLPVQFTTRLCEDSASMQAQ